MNKFIFVIFGLIVLAAMAMTGFFPINLTKENNIAGVPRPSSFILRKDITFTVSGQAYGNGNPEEKFLLAGADKDLTPKKSTMAKIGTVKINGEIKEVWRCHVDQRENVDLDYIYVVKDIDKFVMDVYLSENKWDKYPHDGDIVVGDELIPIEQVSVDFTIVLNGEEKLYTLVRETDGTAKKEIFNALSTQSLDPNPIVVDKKLDDLENIDVYKFRLDDVSLTLYGIKTGIDIFDGKEHDFYILNRITGPKQTEYVTNKTLQLKTFKFVKKSVYPWWLPDCKPAIYLYPNKKTSVSVKVFPKGFFTLTIPEYPLIDGWKVTAYPDGTIEENGDKYPYLYYESKIKDSEINKPTKGFVIKFNDLDNFYDKILTKLGLSGKEKDDFKNYWSKALPHYPYYFIGIMKEEDITKIEPMTIVPKPDTIIRVRLYFQPLDNTIEVEEPDLGFLVPGRVGFTVVEWGGMVKTDKDHPFTCSQ